MKQLLKEPYPIEVTSLQLERSNVKLLHPSKHDDWNSLICPPVFYIWVNEVHPLKLSLPTTVQSKEIVTLLNLVHSWKKDRGIEVKEDMTAVSKLVH